MERKVKLGIIGFGNMGTAHAANIVEKGLCPEIELTAIADHDPERLAAAKEKYGDSVALFDTALGMLDSGLVEAALIAIPHYEHPAMAMACFDRGIHVMCEKPAGVYTKQVREMNEAAERSDAVFGMMFNQRTDHVYRKMRELVQSGQFGALRRANWIITTWYRSQSYYDSGAWRATWSGEGGGVLLNQCPHQLDLLQWICGMPAEISAHLSYGKWHDIEVEDDVTAYLKFPNGATGVFVTSTGDFCGTNRFEIQLDRAKLVAENGHLTVTEYEMSEPEFSRIATGSFPSPMKMKVYEPKTDGLSPQHPEVLNRFAARILRGEPMIAEGTEGINGLTVSNAMHLSDWLGKPVSIPFDEDLFLEELKKRIKTSRRKENVTAAFGDTSGTYNTK